MNYRHIFHAGNLGDVFKHSILTVMLENFTQKEKNFCYIDTHAGIGLYDLQSQAAQRSLEYKTGIEKVLSTKALPELANYLRIVNACRHQNPCYYPGSPWLVKYFLRPGDKMIVNELHPVDFQKLKQLLGKNPQIHYHHRDAYEFLPAIVPPTPRRAIILIDPPYEQANENMRLIQLMDKSIKRFSQGIYMLWYPIVSHDSGNFVKQLIKRQYGPTLISEFTINQTFLVKTKLSGCGFLIINPPWMIEKKIEKITHYFWNLFHVDARSFHRTELYYAT